MRLALLLLTALALGCQRAPAPRRPSILLISLDTLRADVALPSLMALSQEAATFSRAYVPMPFTLPSHMSMMTGLYPEAHYVVLEEHTLPTSVTTLAAALSSAGYRTVGIHTSDWLQEGFGFGRGFDEYQMLPSGLTFADRVTRAVLEQVDWTRNPAPVFLFLHYLDPHSDSTQEKANTLPYFAPTEDLRDLPLDAAGFCDAQGRCATEFLLAADREDRVLSAEQTQQLKELYSRGTRSLDRQLTILFDGLRDRGVWDELLVVVVSDHGEEFREHGKLLHSQPYEETIRVPLLLRLPEMRHRGATVDAPVSVVDIMPTILDYLRVPAPSPLQGRSLLPLVDGRPDKERVVVSQDKLERRRFALVHGQRKLIMNVATGDKELYDLSLDPDERQDLSAADPRTARELARLLVQQIRDARRLKARLFLEPMAPDKEPFGPEARERLKALGYIR